jgi:hypothetical protein
MENHEEVVMSLALKWLIEGLFIIGVVQAGGAVARRWNETVNYVKLFPGGSAVGTWVALQTMPLAVSMVLVGAFALQFGIVGLGSVLITLACVTMFAALCTVGALLPNVGVTHDTFHETI